MAQIIIGLVLVVIAVVLFIVKKKSEAKALDIKYQETVTTKQLTENYSSISGELSTKGAFSEYAELKGTAECTTPLTAEFSGQQCVYVQSRMIREYEVLTEERDSSGTVKREWRKKTDTMSDTKRSVPFQLTDATGAIMINPDGAQVDLEKMTDRFEPAQQVQFGALRDLLNIRPFSDSSTSRTLGYRMEEFGIPLHKSLYVLGEAHDRNGSLMVSKPSDSKKRFIVSVKSEEEIVRSAESSAKWSYYGAIALAAIGAGVFVWGIIKVIAG